MIPQVSRTVLLLNHLEYMQIPTAVWAPDPILRNDGLSPEGAVR
jgi:hypothetical protein